MIDNIRKSKHLFSQPILFFLFLYNIIFARWRDGSATSIVYNHFHSIVETCWIRPSRSKEKNEEETRKWVLLSNKRHIAHRQVSSTATAGTEQTVVYSDFWTSAPFMWDMSCASPLNTLLILDMDRPDRPFASEVDENLKQPLPISSTRAGYIQLDSE